MLTIKNNKPLLIFIIAMLALPVLGIFGSFINMFSEDKADTILMDGLVVENSDYRYGAAFNFSLEEFIVRYNERGNNVYKDEPIMHISLDDFKKDKPFDTSVSLSNIQITPFNAEPYFHRLTVHVSEDNKVAKLCIWFDLETMINESFLFATVGFTSLQDFETTQAVMRKLTDKLRTTNPTTSCISENILYTGEIIGEAVLMFDATPISNEEKQKLLDSGVEECPKSSADNP